MEIPFSAPSDAPDWSADRVIEQVRELHSPDDSDPDYGTVCSECLGPDEMPAPWPCTTRAITDGIEQAAWPRWRGHASG